jgi:glycine cleavage system H lipoate-binding protein
MFSTDAVVEFARVMLVGAAGLLLRFLVAALIVATLIVLLVPVVYGIEGVRRLLRVARGSEEVHGLDWRSYAFYSPAHLWIQQRWGTTVRLGIDALAARVLRGVSEIRVPSVGEGLFEGQPIASFGAGGHVVSLPAPVTGVVTRVNHGARHPSRVLDRPYDSGWLVEMQTERDLPRLAHASAAKNWFAGDAERLTLVLEQATGIAAADGGVPLTGHLTLTDEQRAEMAIEFLHATLDTAA